MGIVRRITAAPPEPDLRPVARVLDRWRRRYPDQFKLAEFGLDYIRSKLRCWIDDLEDGVGRETRWICFGCRFDFVYGFNEGREIFTVTGLAAWDHDPCCETIQKLGDVAFAPASSSFCRLPDGARRVLNRILFDLAKALDAIGDPSAADGPQASSLPGGLAAPGADFAPPWLPGDYLRAHVPKDGGLRHVFERRPDAGRTQEFEMEKIHFASMIFATQLLHHIDALDRVDGGTIDHMTTYDVTTVGGFAFRSDAAAILTTEMIGAGVDFHDDGNDDDTDTTNMDAASHTRTFGHWIGRRSGDELTAPLAQ